MYLNENVRGREPESSRSVRTKMVLGGKDYNYLPKFPFRADFFWYILDFCHLDHLIPFKLKLFKVEAQKLG